EDQRMCTLVLTPADHFAADCTAGGAVATKCACHDFICSKPIPARPPPPPAPERCEMAQLKVKASEPKELASAKTLCGLFNEIMDEYEQGRRDHAESLFGEFNKRARAMYPKPAVPPAWARDLSERAIKVKTVIILQRVE